MGSILVKQVLFSKKKVQKKFEGDKKLRDLMKAYEEGCCLNQVCQRAYYYYIARILNNFTNYKKTKPRNFYNNTEPMLVSNL